MDKSREDRLAELEAKEQADILKRERKAQRIRDAAAREKERLSRTPKNDLFLHECDVRELHRYVEGESVDVVYTDPPYEHKAVDAGLYGALSDFAAHALRPGGTLAVLTGKMRLLDVWKQIDSNDLLRYRWIVCMSMAGQNPRIFQSCVFQVWKPVLLYEKVGGTDKGRWIQDHVDTKGTSRSDTSHHKWGQTLSSQMKMLDMIASPGDVVCDPFVGGGTTGVAARLLGCAFIGADNDSDAIEITRKRLGEE